MVTATLSYKTTISNFTLQNLRRLQTTNYSTNSHIVRSLFLSRPNKPEELKEILDTQKSPQPDVTVGKSTG